MHNRTAVAMALVLVAGVAGLAVIPVATADHQDCHFSEVLVYKVERDGLTLDGDNPVDVFSLSVPTNDPVTLDPITKAGLWINVTSASGDVAWTVSEDVGGTCTEVESGESASASPDAELEPGDYFIKTERASGTTSVTFEMYADTLE